MNRRLPVRRNGPADPTPRTLIWLDGRGPTVVDMPCEQLHDWPQCYGAAFRGPRHCTCNSLTEADHAWCEREAHRQLRARDYQSCEDCAFRKGSPEQVLGDLERILGQDAPFHCHRGMPARVRGEPGNRDVEYMPRRDKDGVPRAYPVCMGWLRATLARTEGAS